MRRENWKPTKSSILCSDHFRAECLDRTGQTCRVKEDAVPTIFNFPEHLIKVTSIFNFYLTNIKVYYKTANIILFIITR